MVAEPCPPSGHLNCTPNKGTNKVIPFKQTKAVIDYVGKKLDVKQSFSTP